MRLGEPWLLLAVPAALLLLPLVWWLADRRREKLLERFADAATRRRIMPEPPPGRTLARRVLLLLALVALAIAAARPQWGVGEETVRRKGRDVVFVLDTSLSMTAPSRSGSTETRLQAAKRAIQDLVEVLKGDRAALVAFAGEAQIVCPLTIDRGALALFLDGTDPELLPTLGSDLAAGLRKALEVFLRKERKFHVIVLLSDGEDNEGQARKAAEELKSEGVVVHAIGFGSPEGEPIALRGADGEPAGYKKDADGHVVTTRLEEGTLRGVAAATGGIYVSGQSGDRGLKALSDAVAAMEKREISSSITARAEDRVEIFLGIALVLLALELWLGTPPRPRLAPVLRGKTSAPARMLAALGVLGMLAGPGSLHAAPAAAKRGEQAYAKQDYDAAVEAYREALEAEPGSAILHYNLGTALLQTEQKDEALKELAAAAATGSAEIQARARFNMGNAYRRDGKLKEALDEYRRALRVRPDDREAKHNYELTLRELKAEPPPPTPTPSPSPSPEQQPSPSPSPTPEPEGSPSPTPTPAPSGEPSPSPSPSPDPQASPMPTPSEEPSEAEAERLLDALAEQEQAEMKQQKRKPAASRRPLKDW